MSAISPSQASEAASWLADMNATAIGAKMAGDKPMVAGPPYFCTACGTVLLLPAQGPITCHNCGFSATFDQLENRETTLRGSSRPSAARAATAALTGDSKPKRATIEETCPNCNYHEVEYYTMQMRSVDEGSTVFYECFECGHKWSSNN